MALQRKESFSKVPPQKVQLKQCVSCEDITERVQYIQQCVLNKCPVDMRQMVNLYRLAEMYNSAVKKKSSKRRSSYRARSKSHGKKHDNNRKSSDLATRSKSMVHIPTKNKS